MSSTRKKASRFSFERFRYVFFTFLRIFARFVFLTGFYLILTLFLIEDKPLIVGDNVVWPKDDGMERGVVRWVGHLPTHLDWFAGVEFVR